MSLFPRKPQAGDRVLQSLYDSVCQIIDFLPSLEIRGDNKTIKINNFSSGKTISAVAPASASAAGGSEQEIWPKLARIMGTNDNIYYNIRLIDINGQYLDEITYKCIIPQLSLYTTVPKDTIIRVSSVEIEQIQTGNL